MLIIGYDDARSAYRVINSWGTDWGDAGYLWWDYDDMEGRPDFYAYTVTVDPAPQPVLAPDAATFGLNVIGVATYQSKDTGRWSLAVKVRASEPVQVALLEFMRSERRGGVWLSYGTLEFDAGTQAPAPGPAAVRIQGTLRDGTQVMRDLAITIPPPTSSWD
jgi:hypothetical protein